MRDLSQEIFDDAETIALQLHHLQGSVDALYSLLDAPMAATNDKGIRVYAILAAVDHFRASAEAASERIARVAGQVTG